LTEYHNPQNDPGSEKRLLLAFLLVFVMIAVMQYLLPKPQPQPEPQKPVGQQPAQTTAATPLPATATPQPAPVQPHKAVTVPVKQAAAETETVLDNDTYHVVLTNRGAVAKSWVLKNFKDNNGKPLDLVNPTVANALGYPLSLFSYDKELEKNINQALYVPSASGVQGGTVTFEYSDGTVSVRKTFRPEKNPEKNYVLGVETEVTNQGQRVPAFPQWPSGLGDQGNIASYAGGKVDWQQNGSIEHKAAVSGNFITGKKSLSGGQTISGPFDWVGTADQYFAAVFMPESPKDTTLVTLNSPLELPRDPNKPDQGPKDKVSIVGVAAGNMSGPTRTRVFAGPKTVEVLENTQAQPGGPDLRGLTDFGTFGFIARPLFLWLKWTNEHWIHNWGWSIAFLTLVITMALLPLRITSMKSSLKMQKIQPQMKALQEKYKRYSLTDPRRAEMQKEMSELYKREGVNPIGGCFPMLLQMPFLFAFYSMLANAIELRQAGWLWIKDLSAPDPYHILPVIIIVLMFFSQKSMPQAGMDPAQQKMLNFMGPVMFGVLSWSVAAGLSVYWMISTLLGYVQQIAINRSALGQQVRKSMERRTTRKR
jgi:YidC/Oxa1 family membrane protein insertase